MSACINVGAGGGQGLSRLDEAVAHARIACPLAAGGAMGGQVGSVTVSLATAAGRGTEAQDESLCRHVYFCAADAYMNVEHGCVYVHTCMNTASDQLPSRLSGGSAHPHSTPRLRSAATRKQNRIATQTTLCKRQTSASRLLSELQQCTHHSLVSRRYG